MSIDEEKRERSWYYWKGVVNLGDKVLAKALLEHFTELFSRLSALEAAQKAPAEPAAPPQTREPGLYVVKIRNASDVFYLRRWDGFVWTDQDNIETAGNYYWISPRILEPGQ